MKDFSKVIVTGGAGFIGSHLVDWLVKHGNKVVVVDNLSTGRLDFIKNALKSGLASFVKADLKNFNEWVKHFQNADIVYHLAANPEVKTSVIQPRSHFNENILTTFNVLEACRIYGVKFLVFSSSSTVYGEAKSLPTPEDYHPLEPISIYGATKLVSENLIISYSKVYGIRSVIFRFANIVGPRQSHGVIVDFLRKLRENPHKLEILGDGTQKKSYLHVSDLLEAIEFGVSFVRDHDLTYSVFNAGNDDWITVIDIANVVVKELGLKDVKYVFRPATPDGRGWIGDVKFMFLDTQKLKRTGWKPTMTSAEAIKEAVRALINSRMQS